MAGGEGRLAGAVGASVPDKYVVKNKIGGGHKDDRNGGPAKLGVDFGERFGFDPLGEGEKDKEC